MKLIAIILNLAFLGFLIYSIIGDPNDSILYLLLLVPIINLFALFFSDKDNWINLYFKRKALEEKKKIAELEK
jgi:hypothetical protein